MTVESPNNINKSSLLHCTIKKNPVGKKTIWYYVFRFVGAYLHHQYGKGI
jgi:hypothetical protein